MIDLKNLNIILTGATGGIGRSILYSLNKYNAKIIATGTNENKLNQIKEQYRNVQVKKFDILNHSSIEKFIDECNEIYKATIIILKNFFKPKHF